MYFTKQDYERILDYIISHSVKDTQFEETYSINGQELISLVQNGVNKNVTSNELSSFFVENGVDVRIQQNEGNSTTLIMSQKAVTDAINSVRASINLNTAKGTVQQQLDNLDAKIDELIQIEVSNEILEITLN